MHFTRILAATALAIGLASPVLAEGLTLKLEGGLGFNRGEDVGIFSLVRTPPASATSQLGPYGSLSRGPLSFTYRGEGSWAFELGSGTRIRLGGIVAGSTGSSSETTPVYYIVHTRPGGPGNAPPLAEINVCGFPNPCATFDGELSRSYREMLPELMLGRTGADGATTWVGVQGFSGDLSEDSSNRAFRETGFAFDRTTVTELDAEMTGVMLAVAHERKLKSGVTLLIGAGFGRYDGDATGLSLEPVNPGLAKSVAGSFDGNRAQLSVGIEKPVGKNMTLGATVRADYWSDQPRIQMDWSTPPCSTVLCSPPAYTGNFGLATDPYLSMSFGLSLTFRM